MAKTKKMPAPIFKVRAEFALYLKRTDGRSSGVNGDEIEMHVMAGGQGTNAEEMLASARNSLDFKLEAIGLKPTGVDLFDAAYFLLQPGPHLNGTWIPVSLDTTKEERAAAIKDRRYVPENYADQIDVYGLPA